MLVLNLLVEIVEFIKPFREVPFLASTAESDSIIYNLFVDFTS